MSARRFEKVRRDFEDHPVLTLGIPAVLPPPFPLKIFILSAGAFDMRWLHFATVVFVARLVRFGALAGLTIVFGPGIITLFTTLFRRHPAATLVAIAAVVGAALLVHRFHTRRARNGLCDPQELLPETRVQ
jgi:membrane protein DedA with SNARE-associated domain